MKLKYTTKLFIVVNLIAVAFRTVQIMFLTESGTAFLKTNMLAANIIGTVLVVLSLGALCFNANGAVRQPEALNCKGIPSAIVACLSGILYLAGGCLGAVSSGNINTVLLASSVALAVACTLLTVTALGKMRFPKGAALLFLVYWLVEFICAYLFYTEKALRVRTVYETFAICAVLLFSVTLGKAISGVSPEKNFRRIYPLGLLACTLCNVSLIPELIAWVCGFGDKVTESAVMPLSLAAAAIFTGFFTINTFKKSNTIHPKMKKRMEEGRIAKDWSYELKNSEPTVDEPVTQENSVNEE